MKQHHGQVARAIEPNGSRVTRNNDHDEPEKSSRLELLMEQCFCISFFPFPITLHCTLSYLPKTHKLLLVDKQAGHALAGADAHARHQDLLLLPPQLAQARDDLARAGGAERVAP